ncbi:NADH-ubiquinone oxidoreductase chain [Olea europaea subsp. europaea]|uniref:NADH-ubiquinone oxidoreductase chain n=1 Tax=Olea europaea subsp. europaea TaxID=158383 RepID=A0A8S0RCL3_OLEEU|nr:NADH-ubiquinone oxidoreductase chain [Olea europaea subsp. europaea]
MITRSKLVEQLRDNQIRSQHKCLALTVFSPKPAISSWIDAAVAIFWALLFSVLLVSSYISLYLRHYWISFIIICLAIFLPVRLRTSRRTLAKKRERRLMLPLSM